MTGSKKFSIFTYQAQEQKRRVKRSAGDKVETNLLEWAYGGVLDDNERESLSPAMREACPDQLIHWMYRVHDTASVHRTGGVQGSSPGRVGNHAYVTEGFKRKYLD